MGSRVIITNILNCHRIIYVYPFVVAVTSAAARKFWLRQKSICFNFCLIFFYFFSLCSSLSTFCVFLELDSLYDYFLINCIEKLVSPPCLKKKKKKKKKKK